MNKNVESHFATEPTIDIQRSIFDRSARHITSFNVGDLIPFYVDEVLPGDTFKVETSVVARLQTMLTPVYDNLYLDVYWFYTPDYILWTHAKEFFGENTNSAWVPQVTYQIPSISAPSGGFATGTIADYMGLPVGVDWDNTATRRPSALPFRGYAMIADQFFRDQNLTDPLNIPLGDSNQTGTNGNSYINDVANGGMPFKVAKYHDYFTSALPAPQKGPTVTFPLLNGAMAPVGTGTSDWISSNIGSNPLQWKSLSTAVNVNAHNIYGQRAAAGTGNDKIQTYYDSGSAYSASGTPVRITPTNLYADLSTNVGAVSINELRMAFQLQKYYEKMALGGSRYRELLAMQFGVHIPDSVVQVPQYLGGNRIPLNIREVLNTAQTQSDFLGDVGGMSVTADISESFTQSFVAHGYVFGLCCVRYDHTYSQGLERFWSRRNTTDFYLPVFANLGETPVYKSEIYADATNMATDTVFAYQECWADYRYKPDRCSGEMRPGIQNTLASWHFADYYAQEPTLSDAWIREDKTNVDRTLAVTSSVSNQVFADFYVKNICTRPMPLYSIPGLIDHH